MIQQGQPIWLRLLQVVCVRERCKSRSSSGFLITHHPSHDQANEPYNKSSPQTMAGTNQQFTKSTLQPSPTATQLTQACVCSLLNFLFLTHE